MKSAIYRTESEEGYFFEFGIDINGEDNPRYYAALRDLEGNTFKEEDIDKETIAQMIYNKEI